MLICMKKEPVPVLLLLRVSSLSLRLTTRGTRCPMGIRLDGKEEVQIYL